MCTCACVSVCACMYACLCVCVNVCMSVYLCVCVYVRARVCLTALIAYSGTLMAGGEQGRVDNLVFVFTCLSLSTMMSVESFVWITLMGLMDLFQFVDAVEGIRGKF